MDKPISLSVKDFLIRKMSVKMIVPEYVIDAVVSHQFQSATQAMVDKKSVEISGFGKFLLKEKKAITRMEKYLSQKELFTYMSEDPSISQAKRESAKLKLNTALANIEVLKKQNLNVNS